MPERDRRAPARRALRAPGFLLWLERYCGTYAAPGQHDARGAGAQYVVGRANDGLLVARTTAGRAVPLDVPLAGATLTRTRLEAEAALRPPPLGSRPVALPKRLVARWTTAAEAERLRGAEHVGRGREVLLALISFVEFE